MTLITTSLGEDPVVRLPNILEQQRAILQACEQAIRHVRGEPSAVSAQVLGAMLVSAVANVRGAASAPRG